MRAACGLVGPSGAASTPEACSRDQAYAAAYMSVVEAVQWRSARDEFRHIRQSHAIRRVVRPPMRHLSLSRPVSLHHAQGWADWRRGDIILARWSLPAASACLVVNAMAEA